VGAGLIAGPANLSLAGLMQWTGSPALATLSLVRSVLIIPVVGAVFFIFTGSLIRAALLLRHAPGNGHDAHARAPADLQPEQSVWH
jgi:hypothetical protein